MRFFALILFFALSANAATKYVATTGSNGADGSIGTPYLTLTYAITQISGGDTIYLRGGTFTNDWNLTGIPSGSSWSATTTIAGYPGESAIIRPQTVADVFGINGTSGRYVKISDLEIDLTLTHSTGAGVKITENADFWMITNCNIHHVFSGHCILITGGTADKATNNIIVNSLIHHAGWQYDGGTADHGIYVKTRNNLFSGLTIYQNYDHAIHSFDGTPDGNVVANSRFWGNQTGLGFHSAGSVSNTAYNCTSYSNNVGFYVSYNATSNSFLNCSAWRNVVGFFNKEDAGVSNRWENCIAFLNSSSDRSSAFACFNTTYPLIAINCLSASNTINTIYNTTGSPITANNLVGDSNGAGLIAGDDLPLVSGSAAIDAGRTQTFFTTDINNRTRPVGSAWDIGAYEYATGTDLPVTLTGVFSLTGKFSLQ